MKLHDWLHRHQHDIPNALLLVAVVLALVAFSSLAKAEVCTLKWSAHPDGAAVNIRIQTSPTETGLWTTLSPDTTGSATSRIFTCTLTNGKLCAKARAIRLSDSVAGPFSEIACNKPPPAGMTGVTLEVKP